MKPHRKGVFFGIFSALFLFSSSYGFGEGSKELNLNGTLSTQLYSCNDFANQCSSSAGLRSQFAAYDDSQSAADVDRLYFVTQNGSEVVYIGFQGGGITSPANPARHIVYRIKNLAGTIVQSEQDLPTSGTGYISTLTQAQYGPNQLITTPPYNGYDAVVFNPPAPGTYYIEFSVRRDDNNAIYVGHMNLILFDLTVGNPTTHLAKPGRLYSKCWQFYESASFYGKNYIISDDSIVTSAQFTGMEGGHWNQYCNQTGCGSDPDNWINNRKSLYEEQALYPQYKIFLNQPDPLLFPPASTLGQILTPLPYGVQNCTNGHIVFHVKVDKPGNVEIDLTFPAPYVARTLSKTVVAGDNLVEWDGLDGTTPTGLPVPNGTVVTFTVQYINGLTNLPLYDVEENANGFIIALVSPSGTTPSVYWDDTNIPGGTNNSTPPGCTSPPASGCHIWSGNGWGDLNTVNTWWYNVSTTTAAATVVEYRGSQTLTLNQSPPQVFCANTGGHVFSVTPDPNTETYHWSFTPSAGVTFAPAATTSSYTVTVTFGPTASSGTLQVYGSNANCPAGGPVASLPVTINPLPTPTISGPSSVCVNAAGNVYSTQTGMSNYTWTVSAGGTITAGAGTSAITVTWTTTGAKTVTVNYTNANGCTAVSPATYNVTVTTLPVPTISGPASVCVNSAGNIYSTQTGMTGYTWTVSAGGTITAGAGTSAITVTWTTTGAKTVTVNYTNSGNCTAASPTVYNVTVNPLPTPTISGPASVCVNSAGNVYSTQTGMSNYTWTVSAGGTITAGSGTSAITVTWTTTGTKTVTVNYTNANNCTAASPATYSVTVNALPVPAISGPSSACVNSTGNVYSTQTGMSNYAWTVSAGGTITSGAGTSAITVTWTTAGSKTVTVNYTNASNCTAAAPTVYNVTVYALPAPTISGPSSACVNSTGNVYMTQSGMSNYTWTVSPGGTITSGTGTSAIVVTWTTTGTKVVTVNYYNAGNCTAPNPTSYTVTVYALPTPAISGPASVCTNSSGNVYTTQTGMSGYTWTVSAGGTITSGAGTYAIIVTWNTPGSKTVTVNYTNGNNCTAASPTAYNVTVNPLPVPAISGPASVCVNSTGNIYTTQAGMTGYTWTVSAGGIITGGSGTSVVTVSWSTSGTKTVTVNYTNAYGCTAAEPTGYPVTVNPLPVPVISGPASVCLNSSGNVYSTESGMTGYAWTVPPGGTITAGAGTGAITVTWTSPGAKTVTVNYTDANGCTAASATVFNVTVNTLPAPTIAGPVSVCLNSTGNVYTTEAGMTGYTWTLPPGGVITSGAGTDAITVTWTAAGTGAVTVNYDNPNNCTAAAPATRLVTVHPLPVPTITGPATACLNTAGPVYFTEGGMTNYSWSVPGGTATQGVTPDTIHVVWNSTGMHDMTLTYTDQNLCDPAQPAQKSVLVNTIPYPGLTGATLICTGVQTTYSTDAGMNGYAWSVSSGGTIVSGGQPQDNTATVIWNTAGPQHVSVNYSLANGCYAVDPPDLAVTVNQTTTPVISQDPAEHICFGSDAVYATQPGMSNYVWTISSGGTIVSPSGTDEITVHWSALGPQWVTVTFTNTYQCNALAPTRFDLVVNPLPETSISTAPGPQCESVQHLFQTPPVAGCTFTWTINPAAMGTVATGQGTNTAGIEWQLPGQAVVSVLAAYDATGCSSSSSFMTTVYPKPNPVFTPCFDVVTTTDAKKFELRGASPFVAGQGQFSGARVSLNAVSGKFEFDPYGAAPGTYPVKYTYTNTYGCPASPPDVSIVVQKQVFGCGSDLTDVRDGKKYKTSLIGDQCWMAEDLAYGGIIDGAVQSTDNCINERYCPPEDPSCSTGGSLYQWEELMRYGSTSAGQGICPPGWHVPSETEWQTMLYNLGAGVTPPDGIAGSFLKDPYLYNGFHATLKGILYQNNTWAFTSGGLTGALYWTCTQTTSGLVITRGVNSCNPSTSKYSGNTANAFPARCVKD